MDLKYGDCGRKCGREPKLKDWSINPVLIRTTIDYRSGVRLNLNDLAKKLDFDPLKDMSPSELEELMSEQNGNESTNEDLVLDCSSIFHVDQESHEEQLDDQTDEYKLNVSATTDPNYKNETVALTIESKSEGTPKIVQAADKLQHRVKKNQFGPLFETALLKDSYNYSTEVDIINAAKALYSKRTRTLMHWINPKIPKARLKTNALSSWNTLPIWQKKLYVSQVLGKFGMESILPMVNPELRELSNFPDDANGTLKSRKHSNGSKTKKKVEKIKMKKTKDLLKGYVESALKKQNKTEKKRVENLGLKTSIDVDMDLDEDIANSMDSNSGFADDDLFPELQF